MSEPISVRSKNWTPLGLPTASSAPTSQDFSGTSRATVNFGMPSQNIAVKITLSGNSNDRSKTPHLTNIAIYDPATYVSEEPNAGGNETGAANVGINRSAVADAVLDALGLTDLVSGGRSHAFNDEQKAKAEKYVQFLASPDFTAKVSAAGNSKVLWVDLSDWNP